MSRKIAVITGTRAEYGLLKWTMKELLARGVELQLIVTGAHLSPAHGMTVRDIEADRFAIAARVDMQFSGDSPVELAAAMGHALSGVAESLATLKPDLVVILGDRYEMLAAASAAAMLSIPIAHIHGGEVTVGALDESLRHAITKLSYWHFATAEPYAQRIVQLGEAPERVFTAGAPGIDNIVRLPLLSREALEKELGIALKPPVILFTYHPETLSTLSPQQQINRVLSALEKFPDATLIITGANADSGGRAINAALEAFSQSRKNTLFKLSFGSLLYLSAMKQCDVVVGNSSSAMIEAPTLGKVSVNIGARQEGRLRVESIIDCPLETTAIASAIQTALSTKPTPSPLFGKPGQVAVNIAEKLVSLPLPATPKKPFYDIHS